MMENLQKRMEMHSRESRILNILRDSATGVEHIPASPPYDVGRLEIKTEGDYWAKQLAVAILEYVQLCWETEASRLQGTLDVAVKKQNRITDGSQALIRSMKEDEEQERLSDKEGDDSVPEF